MSRITDAIEKYGEVAKYTTLWVNKPRLRRSRRFGHTEVVNGYYKRIKSVTKHGIPKKRISQIALWDPSPNQKYLDWILSTKINLKLNYGTIQQFIILFHKAPQKFTYKDIYQYKTKRDILFDLHNASINLSKREVKNIGAYVIEETKDYKVIIPNTIEASRLYGSDTKWCTTQKNHFDFYNKEYIIYYCLIKKPSIVKLQSISHRLMKVAVIIHRETQRLQMWFSDDKQFDFPESLKNSYTTGVDFYTICLNHFKTMFPNPPRNEFDHGMMVLFSSY